MFIHLSPIRSLIQLSIGSCFALIIRSLSTPSYVHTFTQVYLLLCPPWNLFSPSHMLSLKFFSFILAVDSHSLNHSCMHVFIHSLIHLFFLSFCLSFFHAFIQPLIQSTIHSTNQSTIHSFSRSFNSPTHAHKDSVIRSSCIMHTVISFFLH